MRAIILVGGEGTRLRPLSLACPKSMAPMAGRPFLEYPLALLKRHGVRDVVLSTFHLTAPLRRRFGDGRRYGLRLQYALEPKPLGTGGGIRFAAQSLPLDQPVFIFNGDVLTDLDLTRMAAQHRRRKARVSIALTRVQDPSAYGLVRQDPDHRIRKFIEKPGPGETAEPWVNAGIYLFSPEVFTRIPLGRPSSVERELFPSVLAAGERVWGFPNPNYWLDIGTLPRYLQANQDLLEHRLTPILWGRPLAKHAGVRLGIGCRVARTAHLHGPVWLGDGCAVGQAAEVSEGVVCGARVKIGAGASIEGSVIWDDVRIGAGARLQGCVVANGCRLGDHVHVRPGSVLGAGTRVPDYSKV